jgi:hypothetical protein
MQRKEFSSFIKVEDSCVRCKIVIFATMVPFHVVISKKDVYQSYILGLILASFLTFP